MFVNAVRNTLSNHTEKGNSTGSMKLPAFNRPPPSGGRNSPFLCFEVHKQGNDGPRRTGYDGETKKTQKSAQGTREGVEKGESYLSNLHEMPTRGTLPPLATSIQLEMRGFV